MIKKVNLNKTHKINKCTKPAIPSWFDLKSCKNFVFDLSKLIFFGTLNIASSYFVANESFYMFTKYGPVSWFFHNKIYSFRKWQTFINGLFCTSIRVSSKKESDTMSVILKLCIWHCTALNSNFKLTVIRCKLSARWFSYNGAPRYCSLS